MSSPPLRFRQGSTSSNPASDRLGNEHLAQSLATALCNQSDGSILVIGLCGEWGSGKSWVLQRVRHILEQRAPNSDGKKPFWLEFNPWQWNGTEALVTEFFSSLGKAVEDIEPKPQNRWFWRKRTPWTAARFRFYGARLSAHSVVVGGYSQLIAGVSGLVTLLAAAQLYQKNDGLSLLTLVISGVLSFASGTLKLITDFFAKMDEAKKAEEELYKKSLQTTKTDLIAKMSKLSRPIIVVLDDLDRLTADEIASVFQLVKAQANFPNIYYLLAFDREIVEVSLERIAPGVPGNGLPPGRGRQFLEKIVPVLFDLPIANEQAIEQILRADIQAIPGISLREANTRWTDWWRSGLSHFFTNLRDVERFVNGAAFNSYLLTEGEGELEVDALDFVGIETLRLFEPQVYQAIARNKETLTNQ